jgi:UDP-glucose 4-epimerase
VRLTGKKVIVTGGAGFIGSHLCRHLLKQEADVLVIDNLFTGKKELLPDGVMFERMDICSKEVGKVIRDFKPDIVIHLAAIHYIPYCNSNPDKTFEVNVMGTRNLLENCNNAKWFLFASSAAVYPPVSGPLTEDMYGPIDIYGMTKLIGEDLVRLYRKNNAIIARIFNVYGPNDTNPHVIPEIINQVKRGRRKIELGNLSPKRDYIHVNDVCEAILALLEHKKSGVYNIGTGKEHSVEDIVDLVSEILGEELQVEQVKERIRLVERMHLLADIYKIQSETGWKAKIELKEGLKGLINFVKQKGEL